MCTHACMHARTHARTHVHTIQICFCMQIQYRGEAQSLVCPTRDRPTLILMTLALYRICANPFCKYILYCTLYSGAKTCMYAVLFLGVLCRTQYFKESIMFMHESRLKGEGCLVHWWGTPPPPAPHVGPPHQGMGWAICEAPSSAWPTGHFSSCHPFLLVYLCTHTHDTLWCCWLHCQPNPAVLNY